MHIERVVSLCTLEDEKQTMKTQYSTDMLLALMLAAAGNSHAGDIDADTLATTGTLRFEGLIESGTCDLAAGDVNRTITLPTVRVPDFEGVNSAGSIDFDLTANCDADIVNVNFTFTGTPNPIDTWRFANTGTAANVSLGLSSVVGGIVRTIRANGTDNVRGVPTAAGQAVIPLRAYYWGPGAVAKGTLISNVTVSIAYN